MDEPAPASAARRVAPVLLLLLLAPWISAQTLRTGAQQLTFRSSADDTEQPYALYLPKTYSPTKRYPVVVSLHSEDSNHRMNLRQVFGFDIRIPIRDTEDLRFFPPVKDQEFIVASPWARGSMGYRGIAERDVYEMLADIEKRFGVDEDRVYLTGVSMGGAGALYLALTRPDVWAAVAPVCPFPAPGVEQVAGNALNLPVRIFQGEQDPLVPAEGTRAWQRRLLDAGVQADYIEYPAVRHNAWDGAYKNGAIFDWFGKFKRNSHAEHIRLTTNSYRYGSAYWLQIDALTPGTPALIDATWNGNTALRVETQNIDGFTVKMGRIPALPLTVTIDGNELRIRMAETLSFQRTGGQWRAGRASAGAKHAGAEGPIVEAVSGRHLYVYGTLGAKTAEELDARRKSAESAAAWSSVHGKLTLSLPVKADHAVTAADLDSSDLVLFGNAESNALVSRLTAQLPLVLSPGAADYGLLFIAPVGKHYVLVSSGLPWWTGAEEVSRGGDPSSPQQYRLLSTFGDYLLFKGSLANVVAEGRFDRNWKLPADAAAKIAATGVVSIR